MIRGVIFDLGQTLIRFEGDRLRTYQESRAALVKALQDDGLEFDSRAFRRAFTAALDRYYREREVTLLETGLAGVLQEVLARFGLGQIGPESQRRALDAMYAVSEARWKVLPAAAEVLQELQADGLRLGLLSNAADEANVQRLVEKSGLRPFLGPILVSAALGVRKPDPRAFQAALQAMQLPPHEVVMVGDTLQADVLGARRMGMPSIWLRPPDFPQDRAPEPPPDLIAQDLRQVPDLIRSLQPADAGG